MNDLQCQATWKNPQRTRLARVLPPFAVRRTRPCRPQFAAPVRCLSVAAQRQALTAWQRGRTGYPIVDAGMRELWQTGVMHNRVRMIAASFLVKHLLIDWREGEKWFWDTLVDADPGSNPANWQWVAGSGRCGALFPRVQSDPAGREFRSRRRLCQGAGSRLARLSGMPHVHQPWRAAPTPISASCRRGTWPGTIPRPIIDHKIGRERALCCLCQGLATVD